MPLDMMHAHQWQLFSIADGFCLRHSDKQCSNKPRAVGDTDRIHIIQRHPRIRKCLSNHLIDFFNVFARGNLRNNAAIQGMQCNLGGYHI